MQNKQTLLGLVDRAERGVLLAGEAQILRDAIEMLDDMAMTMESVLSRSNPNDIHPGYDASTTQSFRIHQAVSGGDFEDDRSGCP